MASWTDPWVNLLPEAARGGGLLLLDLETQGREDVTSIGGPAYARSLRDEPTPVMCCAYYRPHCDRDIQLWTPGASLDWLYQHTGGFVAHNVEFEYWVLREVWGLDIPPELWLDTAALGRHWSYPGSLDEATGEKDKEGKRIMLKLSKPRRPSKTNPEPYWTPETKPDDFARLYSYCKNDVWAMARFLRALEPPRAGEKAVMDLTFRMNLRGLRIDQEALQQARKLAKADQARISAKCKALTGASASQVAVLAKNLGVKSLAKDQLRDMLRDPAVSEKTKQALRLRQEYAKASVAKVDAFLRHQLDGRIYDGLIYGGAERTLRWSGRGIQPQNMPRGGGMATLALFDELLEGRLPDTYTTDDGDEISGTQDIIKSLVRGFIVGPLLVGDYSQIEARILSWYAGDEEMLHAFANKLDPYKLMAAGIYHKDADDVTKPERFMGKQTVLGAGYGLWVRGFRSMLSKTYDVHLDEEEATRILKGYRRKAKAVVQFWERIEGALQSSRDDGTGKWIDKGKRLGVRAQGDQFYIQLPSGRRITYRQVDWGKSTYHGRLPNGAGYGRTGFYGGAMCGHIVQGTARDLMSHALLQLDAEGFPLILTVHDEAVSEDGDLELFDQTMRRLPPWATELPVDVECFRTERYRK
jgi:DNA polymerase